MHKDRERFKDHVTCRDLNGNNVGLRAKSCRRGGLDFEEIFLSWLQSLDGGVVEMFSRASLNLPLDVSSGQVSGVENDESWNTDISDIRWNK